MYKIRLRNFWSYRAVQVFVYGNNCRATTEVGCNVTSLEYSTYRGNNLKKGIVRIKDFCLYFRTGLYLLVSNTGSKLNKATTDKLSSAS